MYRELARARQISCVTQKGELNLCQTGKNIKRAFELHNIQPQQQYLKIKDHLAQFLEENLPIIWLDSKRLLLWNLIFYLAIYYFFLTSLFAIFIGVVLDYEVVVNQPFNQVSMYAMFITLLVDIVAIRWRVEFKDSSSYTNHYIVAKRYFIYYFPIDFITLVVVILEIAHVQTSYAKLLIYLKVFMLVEIQEHIIDGVDPYPALWLLFNALRLLLFIAFCSFFFACVYVLIELHYIQQGGYYYQNGFLWLTSAPTLDYVNLYENFNWIIWFQYALFFVMQMVRGCGLGVPSPRNPLSMLWYNISNVTMSIMFWYFTDRVITLIYKFYQKQSYVQNLANLHQLRQIKIISQESYRRYQKFLKTSLSKQIQAFRVQKKLVQMFPLTLRIQFNFALKQHFLLRFSYLNSIVSHTFTEELFRRELAQIIHSKVVYQDQVLYRRNQVRPAKLYLSQSIVFIQSNYQLDYVQKLQEWSFIGMRQFFIEKKSLFDVVASRIATVEYIDSEQFKAVVKFYPMVYESYCQRIDSILIQRQQTESIELRCWHCSQFHLSEDCKKIKLDQSKLMAILGLRRLNLNAEDKATQILYQQDKPFFRKGIESLKIRRLFRPRLEIDKFKKRGFSYLNYNLEAIEFHSKLMPAIVSQSEVFRLRRSESKPIIEMNDAAQTTKKKTTKITLRHSETFRIQRTINMGAQSRDRLQGQDK